MEKQFRGSLFGGYNRRDVLAYIREHAAEGKDLREENEALKARVDDLQEQLIHAARQREYLRMVISQLEEKTEKLENDSLKQAEEYRISLKSASDSLQEMLACLKAKDEPEKQEGTL